MDVLVHVEGKQYRAHRVIWIMIHGSLDIKAYIDHINCDAWDNRLANLRIATKGQNGYNRGMNKNNTTGFKGVFRTESGKFFSHIGSKGKYRYLGTFDTPEEAHAVYCAAAEELHGEFARTS